MKYILLLILSYSLHCPATEILVSSTGKLNILKWKLKGPLKVGDSKIVGAKLINNELLLTGKQLGSTSVEDSQRKIQVLITKNDQFLPINSLINKLKNHDSLMVNTEGDKLIVTGYLNDFSDWLSLQSSDAENWEMRASLDGNVRDKFERFLLPRLQKLGLAKNLHFEYEPGLKLITSPNFTESFPLAARLLSRFGVRIVTYKALIQPEPNVRVKIWITEIKKNQLKNLGLTLPNTFTKTNFTPELSLQLLEQNGQGKILANPNILARSGEPASFFAGGEFPMRIKNYRTADVQWKKFGIEVKTKSDVDSLGRVRLDLETSVSNIVGDEKIDGLPSMSNTKLTSKFDLKNEQVVMLSGLINSATLQNKSGLPYLQNLPILGALFSSQEFIESLSELVIFVKPEIIYE